MAGTKFSSSEPRLLALSVAALIMLSAAVVTEEARQCYWCGPLADQVHRSQRAPACDGPGNQVTTCDPGLSYCAIVATSPPYVESRYCVKNYREECYPLYCNTTRTWKMTCPCKDNLCNGPNTEREKEAFALLAKLVEKNQTKRISKRTDQSSPITMANIEQIIIITDASIIQENLLNGTFDENYEATKEQLTQIVISNEPIIDTEVASLENIIESTEDTITFEDGEDTTIGDIITTETDLVPEKSLSAITTNEPQLLIATNIQNPIVGSQMDSTPKPSEELPTAEALQQNASPVVVSEKTIAPTTLIYESTTLTTIENVEKPTEEPKLHKNGGDKINSSALSIATYILLQLFSL